MIFFFKQKTAYEMRISDWSSDVCSARAPVELEGRQALARRRLESLASGDGGVEISESVFERLDLANLAATVGVVGPAQPGFVLRRQFLGIGRQRDEIQPQPRRERVAIGERFGEMLAGIEEEHRDIRRD